MADDSKKKADDAKKSLEEIGEITGALEEGFRALTSRLSDIVDEIIEGSSEARSFDLTYKDINRSVKSLSKITEDLIKNQVKINEKSISSKEIQNQINKKIAEQQVLTTRIGSLQKQLSEDASISENERIEKQNLINKLQNDFKELSFAAIEPLQKQKQEVEGIEQALEETNKKLGVFSGVLKGIKKIPILGDIIDTSSALEAAQKAAQGTGSSIKGLSAGISNLSGQVFKSLTNPANIALFVFTEIIATLKSVDSAIGDLAKGFDLTYNGAANLRMELTDIANLSGDVAVTTKGLQESMMAVGQTLGSNARLNKEDLITFTKLREQAGYTNDELAGIQKLTLATGGNLEDNTASFLGSVAALNGQNKLTINAKQLLKEVANTSDSIKLSIGGTTEKLAEAAFKAKQFGINLQQADHISQGLLDFESSISNELSAELITGKDLNLEKARLLAINGDIAGASAEILQQVGGTAEFSKMNRIQQEAIAKATGLTRDDLAKSLMDREALVALSGVEGENAKEKYDNLVKQVGVEEAKKRLGNEALANQFQQQSVQERFTQTIEKLKEIFVSLIEPLMPVFDVFADIMGIVGPIVGVIGTLLKYTIQWGKYLLIPYGIMKGMSVVSKGMTAINTFLIAQNATKIAQNQTQATLETTKLGLGQSILATLGLQNAAQTYQYNRLFGNNILTSIRAAMEETILGKLVMQGWNLGKNLIKYVATTVQTGFRMVMENTIVGSILAQGAGIVKNIAMGAIRLVQAMATAAAELMGVSAMTLGIGTAVAVAAAVAGYAALKSMKDGEIDPSGGPIMFGEFGAVKLNPKDKAMYGADGTIKVGTDLMGKDKTMYGADGGIKVGTDLMGKDKTMYGADGGIKVGNNRGNSSQPQAQPQQDLSPLLEELRALRQESSKSNNKPVVVENSMNGTKFGTSVAMNTYKLQ
jgi:hypothetical protein